jgi:hypothetical protein
MKYEIITAHKYCTAGLDITHIIIKHSKNYTVLYLKLL